MSQISCPHCGQAFTIPPDQWPQYQGRSITCTQCHRPFPVGVPVAPAPMMGAHPGAYAPQPPAKSGGGMSVLLILGIVGVVLVVIVAGLVAILLPALNRAREQAQRAKCASNIRMIDMALIMYANDARGRYPDKIDQLVNGPLAQQIPADAWVCPCTAHTPSLNSGANLAADLNAGNHFDYVYVGKGLKGGMPASISTVVLLYEPIATHREGSNFGFADGHVEFVKKADAEKMIADLKAGINPPKAKLSSY